MFFFEGHGYRTSRDFWQLLAMTVGANYAWWRELKCSQNVS